MLEISKIRTDGGTQPRVELNNEIVEEYKQAYLDGAEFPPVTVFYDGSNYWLADGFHRYWAAKAAGKTLIYENITHGTQREAVLYSLGANASHGLRRTNADKRKAVMLMLNDVEWSQWSDNQIAKQCGVHQTTVSDYRRSLKESLSDDQKTTERTYTTKHGTQATMQVSNIGKKPEEPPQENAVEEEEPEQEYFGADEDELYVQMEAMQEELESLRVIVESDDRLSAVVDENKQLKAENKTLRLRVNGLMAEKEEAIKLVKSKQRQIDRLEKERANV